MKTRARAHTAVLLTAGLWTVAVFLDTGVLAVHLSARPDGQKDEDASLLNDQPAAPGPVVDDSRPPADVRLKVEEAAPEGQAAGDGEPPRWPDAPEGVVKTGARTDVKTDEAAAEPVPLVHRVAQGETLIGIARGYLGPGADWEAVAEAGLMAPPYTLRVDQEVVIAGAGLLQSAVEVDLVPPVEGEAEAAVRCAFGTNVNSPPARAFEPLERGLRLGHPVWEAFPWTVPPTAGAVFAAAALAAGAYALATAPRRTRTRRAAGVVAWGAASAAGAFFVAGGLGALAAGRMAGRTVAELLFGAATAAVCGLVAYFGAWAAPEAGGSSEPAVRFAFALACCLAGAFVLATLAGWTTPALRSLAPPG